MAQALLTLDRGNSTLDLMLHGAAGGAGPADAATGRRVRHEGPGADAGDLLPVLRELLAGAEPQRAIGVSVVPGGLDGTEAALRTLGVPLLLYGRELPCPLPLAYQTPATLGGDRVLGAFAAHRRFGRAVVVDCGSATTVNLVEQDGTFAGGAIAPGLRALQEGMAARTPHLPRVEPGQPFAMPPVTSASAVAAGVQLLFCGGIERLVADMLRSARGPATVVLTGGHAAAYLRHGRLRPELVPDLVHQGLLLLGETCAC